MNVATEHYPIEEAQRAINQINILARWIVGIISALFMMMVGWMWTLTSISHEMQRTLDRNTIITESQEKDLVHLRGHADRAEEAEGKLDQSIVDIRNRLSTLEASAAQGTRFTAKDGELLAEHIKINEDRITTLEQWRLRMESQGSRPGK